MNDGIVATLASAQESASRAEMSTMKLMGPVGVPNKVVWIAACYLSAVIILTSIVVNDVNAKIVATRLEMEGNAYQRALERVLNGLEELRVAAVSCDAQASDCPARKQADAEVEAGLQLLQGVQERFGTTLQFTPEGLSKRGREHSNPATLAQEWKKARDNASISTDHLIEDVETMIVHGGDTSNLVLDPDLDSYYLADVTLHTMPQMQDRLGGAIARSFALLKDCRKLTQEERLQLAAERAKLSDIDLTRVVSSTETALNEDANFHGVREPMRLLLAPRVRKFRTATQDFLALLDREITSDKPSVDLSDFAAAGDRALEASFTYWDTASVELDGLLRTRLRDYSVQGLMLLGLAGLATGLGTLLTILLRRRLLATGDPGAVMLDLARHVNEAHEEKISS
jgi:hypothetical protein